MVEKFLLVGLKANLPETRDENKLYWCSDTRELYKGNDLYTEAVRVVDAMPATPAQGVLYILPTGEVKVFDGTKESTVAKPYVTSVNGTLSVDNTDDQVPTAKAVYDSIAEAINGVVEGGELVNNIFSTKAGTITVAKGAYTQLADDAVFSEGTNYCTKVGTSFVVDETVTAENFADKVAAGLYVSNDETDFAVKGVVVNPTYDASTRTITLPYADGTESLVIALGKDIFVDPNADNKYNEETGNIEIFLNDGNDSTASTKIEIPAVALVDIYTGATSADGSTTVAVSEDNVITASVNVSAEAGNVLSKKADGLFVDAPSTEQFNTFVDDTNGSLDEIESHLSGEEVVLKENGEIFSPFTFSPEIKVIVDGIPVNVTTQVELDGLLADPNVTNVKIETKGLDEMVAENRAAIASNDTDIEALQQTVADNKAAIEANDDDIAANLESINNLAALVGELPEGATSDNVVDYIEEHVANTERYLDPNAENKYNAESGKIELFLNDQTKIEVDINDYSNGIANDITEVETAVGDLNTFVGQLPEGTTATTVVEYVKEYSDQAEADAKSYADELNTAMDTKVGTVEANVQANADAIAALEVKNDVHIDETAANTFNAETDKVELFLNDGTDDSPATKVEVDMSGLTTQVDGNTEAIAKNAEDIKTNADAIAALETALQWGTF